ncbi:MAG: hypothetical protein Greene101449_421 [Candidatus Peregrinibacteria bacterium Greene1014_49]|nr:MAG: hypothetical protein Greene101449_421 [Candidatus Peregrinibacteria bacterium Greene1014_49]
MIDIPFDVLIQQTCEVGAVYYYKSDHLINTDESHYFVVLAKTDSTFHVVCATTQIEKRKAFVTQRKIPLETLVEITPTKENGLKKLSMVDCNRLFEETLHSLKRKHEQQPILLRGCMNKETVALLINGVMASPLVEREKKRIFT